MTSMAHPRGPLPPRVYWVRRSLVLVLALGLVFGIAQLLGGTSGEDEQAQVVGGAQTPPAGPGLSTTDADPSTSPAKRRKNRDGKAGNGKTGNGKPGNGKPGKPTKTKTPLAQPTGPCGNDEVIVTPKLREEAHAGRVVKFRLKLTTTETPACMWTVSPESLVVKITSGDDRIWSSQDCPDAVPQVDVVVRKDVPAKVDMGWRGQRSDSECSRLPAWAQPGFYYVTTAAYGAEPTAVQFELESPVVPTRTAKPKPEKDSKKSEKQSEKKQDEQDSKRDEQKPAGQR